MSERRPPPPPPRPPPPPPRRAPPPPTLARALPKLAAPRADWWLTVRPGDGFIPLARCPLPAARFAGRLVAPCRCAGRVAAPGRCVAPRIAAPAAAPPAAAAAWPRKFVRSPAPARLLLLPKRCWTPVLL